MKFCILMTLKEKNPKAYVCFYPSVLGWNVPSALAWWAPGMCEHTRAALECDTQTATGFGHHPQQWHKTGPRHMKIKGQYGTPTNAQQRTPHAKASRVPLQAGDTVLQCPSESFPKNSSKGEQRGCEAFSTPTSQSCAEKEHFLKRNEWPFPVSLWSCCSVLISGWKGLDVGDVLLPTLMASHASNHCHTTTLHGYSPFTDGVPYSSSLW